MSYKNAIPVKSPIIHPLLSWKCVGFSENEKTFVQRILEDPLLVIKFYSWGGGIRRATSNVSFKISNRKVDLSIEIYLFDMLKNISKHIYINVLNIFLPAENWRKFKDKFLFLHLLRLLMHCQHFTSYFKYSPFLILFNQKGM